MAISPPGSYRSRGWSPSAERLLIGGLQHLRRSLHRPPLHTAGTDHGRGLLASQMGEGRNQLSRDEVNRCCSSTLRTSRWRKAAGCSCRCGKTSTYTGCCPRTTGWSARTIAPGGSSSSPNRHRACGICLRAVRALQRPPGVDVFVGDFFEFSVARYFGPETGSMTALRWWRFRRPLPALRRAPDRNHCPRAAVADLLRVRPEAHAGPPFAIAGEEVARHYHGSYISSRLDRVEIRADSRAGFRRRRASGCWFGEWPRARRSPDHAWR